MYKKPRIEASNQDLYLYFRWYRSEDYVLNFGFHRNPEKNLREDRKYVGKSESACVRPG